MEVLLEVVMRIIWGYSLPRDKKSFIEVKKREYFLTRIIFLAQSKQMGLKKEFQKYLNRENLIKKKGIIAVSGGIDSMVLLHLMLEHIPAQRIAVFHVHHGVRNQSDDEFQIVQNICSKKGVRFYGYRLDHIPEKDRENFWRKERKRLGTQAMKDFGAERILTAHHATDLVETMIFRLVKGVGLDGLSPFDTSTKPFWQIPKSELIQYAQEKGIKYFEDETNTNIDYERNLIRQEVLPHLRKITPNLEKVCVNEAIVFGEAADFLQKSVQWALADSRSVALDDFLQMHPARQRQWLRMVAHKTPSFAEVEDCLRWLHNKPQGNSQKEIGGTLLRIERGQIMWE